MASLLARCFFSAGLVTTKFLRSCGWPESDLISSVFLKSEANGILFLNLLIVATVVALVIFFLSFFMQCHFAYFQFWQ